MRGVNGPAALKTQSFSGVIGDVGNNGNLSQILLKLTEERARLHYDLFAISKVLPTVPKIRLSCIFCTWFPLRRSDDKGHSIR